MDNAELNDIKLAQFLQLVNSIAKKRFGNVSVDISISRMPNEFVDALSDSGHYQLKHQGRFVDIYSESHTPFEIKPKEIDNSCSDCGEFIVHQPNCPHF